MDMMSREMPKTILHGRDWEELATLDPLWAILGEPEKRFGKWDVQEFFRTGEEEISRIMEKARSLGLPRARQRAIDFGCGVGRLTRALLNYFPECHGVDISNSMVEAARRLTPGGNFRQGPDLKSFSAGYADFIYSTLVLQHQPDRASVARIVTDMVRVLAPGGLLVFQMPLHLPWRNRLQLRRRAYRVLRSVGMPHTFLYQRLKLNPIRMISLPQAEVEDVIQKAGGLLVRVEHSVFLAGKKEFADGIYFCSKKA
jgi:SAM-dependent methyltransferase